MAIFVLLELCFAGKQMRSASVLRGLGAETHHLVIRNDLFFFLVGVLFFVFSATCCYFI